MQLKVTFNFDREPIKGGKSASIFFFAACPLGGFGGEWLSMVVRKPPAIDPNQTRVPKGSPGSPNADAVAPPVSQNARPTPLTEPTPSAFVPTPLPQAPRIASSHTTVFHPNPLELDFSELENQSPRPDARTQQFLDHAVFRLPPSDPLAREHIPLLLGILRDR